MGGGGRGHHAAEPHGRRLLREASREERPGEAADGRRFTVQARVHHPVSRRAALLDDLKVQVLLGAAALGIGRGDVLDHVAGSYGCAFLRLESGAPAVPCPCFSSVKPYTSSVAMNP